jgi:hypothetical protein
MRKWLNESIYTETRDYLRRGELARTRTRWSSILTGIPALAFASIPLLFIYSNNHSDPKLLEYLLMVMLGEGFYLLLSYFLILEPDTNDLGWFGGLMNDPFRISDNVNRLLFFVSFALLPGRLISTALLHLGKALVQKAHVPER